MKRFLPNGSCHQNNYVFKDSVSIHWLVLIHPNTLYVTRYETVVKVITMIKDNIFKGLKRVSVVSGAVSLSGFLTLSPTVRLSANSTAVFGFGESVQAAEVKEENIRQGLPGRRVGGGTRTTSSSTQTVQLPLTALVPESTVSITTAAYPTLLFNLPVSARSQNVEFVLYNSADELLYHSAFNVVGQSGIISVDLSSVEASAAGMMPLEVDETYRWYFSLVAEDRAQDISVDGWIQTVALDDWAQQQAVEPEVLEQLQAAMPLEQSRLLYQDAALWSDAALILHELRQISPEDAEVNAAWEKLLLAVGLGELREVPVAKMVVRPTRE